MKCKSHQSSNNSLQRNRKNILNFLWKHKEPKGPMQCLVRIIILELFKFDFMSNYRIKNVIIIQNQVGIPLDYNRKHRHEPMQLVLPTFFLKPRYKNIL